MTKIFNQLSTSSNLYQMYCDSTCGRKLKFALFSLLQIHCKFSCPNSFMANFTSGNSEGATLSSSPIMVQSTTVKQVNSNLPTTRSTTLSAIISGGSQAPSQAASQADLQEVQDSAALNGQLSNASFPETVPPNGGGTAAENVKPGVPNTGASNSGIPNTGVPNTGVPNTGVSNTGVPNTGVPNTGVPNTGGVPTG